MKKSDFITLITYTVSTLVLALGMCMFTLPDWHLQNIGLPVAIVGLLLEVISWVIQRRLAGKGAPNVNPKLVGNVVYSVVAALVFGGGFALISSGNFVIGFVLSLVGLVLLIGIIPVVVGLKN